MTKKLLPKETYYQWKEYLTVEGEEGPRLLTPWADPHKYEWPMDWLFATKKEALDAKHEHAPQEEWVLVRVTVVPIRVVPAEEDEEGDE